MNNLNFEILEEGIIIIRNCISYEEQLYFIDTINNSCKLKDENGDWNYPDKKNNKKGRDYNSIEEFPLLFVNKIKEF